MELSATLVYGRFSASYAKKTTVKFLMANYIAVIYRNLRVILQPFWVLFGGLAEVLFLTALSWIQLENLVQ